MQETGKIYTQVEFDIRLEREVHEKTAELRVRIDALDSHCYELQNSCDHKDMTIHSLATALANISKGGR